MTSPLQTFNGKPVLVVDGRAVLSVETFDAGGSYGWAVWSGDVRLTSIGDGLPTEDAARTAGERCEKQMRQVFGEL